MLAKIRSQMRRGQIYTGYATWCDDYTLVPKPGFYALDDSGKQVLADVPLVCVDEAPGDAQDGTCHYEYAGPRDYPQRSGDRAIGRGAIIDMEAHLEGRGGLSV